MLRRCGGSVFKSQGAGGAETLKHSRLAVAARQAAEWIVYNIVYDVAYNIICQRTRFMVHTISHHTYDIIRRHTTSYGKDGTYDIVYDMYIRYCIYSTCYVVGFACVDTMAYVGYTMSNVVVRYRHDLRHRTYDVVRHLFVYRTYDIVRAMWHTTSYVQRTMSYVLTYDIVRDVRHRRWQESRCWNYKDI